MVTFRIIFLVLNQETGDIGQCRNYTINSISSLILANLPDITCCVTPNFQKIKKTSKKKKKKKKKEEGEEKKKKKEEEEEEKN